MRPGRGFTLVEVMVALAIGLIVLAGLATVFIAQRQVYSTASSQGAIQNADNALSAILSPAIRGAGFTGCGTLATSRSELVFSTATTPWVFSPGDFSAPVFGYDASGTGVSGIGAGSVTYTTLNAANSTSANDWNPALDASLLSGSGFAEKGSDILILNGEVPGTHPLGVPTVNQAAAPNSFTVYNPASSATAQSPIQFTDMNGQPINVQVTAVAISDCAKSSVFIPVMTTTASTGSIIPNPVQVAASGNKGVQVNPIYQSGTQFVPLQQVAYFVGHGDGNQSALFQATLVNGVWSSQQLVPGIDNMQVLYGVGVGGNSTQYLSADQVQALQANPPPGVVSLPFNPWTIVNSIRIGFLIEGGQGSAAVGSNPTVWNVLGTQVTVPADTRLRHVYVMTVNLRNVTL